MICVHSKLRSSCSLVLVNWTSNRSKPRKPSLVTHVCPNLGHDFLETAPGRLWSPVAYIFRTRLRWDDACWSQQDGSAARITVVAPGAGHGAKRCDISVVKYGEAESVWWATHKLKSGIWGNQIIQVENGPILPKESANCIAIAGV